MTTAFLGVKTAVLRAAQEAIGEDYAFPRHKLSERLSEAQKADIAASFQRIAVETVVDKTIAAYEEFQPKSVVIGGGVAASPELRRQLARAIPYPNRIHRHETLHRQRRHDRHPRLLQSHATASQQPTPTP